ncbi:MAG: preprotein translocase subunit SecY [Dehalococcoidia bacterium]|nr:preprotein translocase subunit SecY [Dehalococcoidia bacterium]
MLQALLNAFKLPDLRRKLLFTFGILVAFRFIAHVPVPGIPVKALEDLFANNPLLGMLDLFSGGAMRNFSIAAMGVYPYITASIIMQLLVPVIPRLEALSKEGEAGRNKINQITHWLTVPLAILQGYGQLALLQNSQQAVPVEDQMHLWWFGQPAEFFLPTFTMLLTMAAGTMICVWLGELITEHGIGNGVSIIIFGGIVATLPAMFGQSLLAGGTGGGIIGLVVFAVLGLATVVAIVVFQEAQRRIPVQYAKRIRGTKMYGGQSSHIPLRVNSAGMIPLIFAMSIMVFPGQLASYFALASTPWIASAARFVSTVFSMSSWFYWVFYFLLVVMFTFFYTMVIFQQQRLSENLQKYGGFIPGIRPGRPTEEYLNRVLYRITVAGAVFLGLVAIMPFLASQATNVQALQLGSTGLLIVVGVVLDTMKQLEAQLLMRHYEGFIK